MEKDLQEFKQSVIEVSREKLNDACLQTRTQMESLRDSLGSEVKSSAGDKHETGRAMVQLEIERASSRLKNQENELTIFERLVFNDAATPSVVTPGCLVATSEGYFYLTVSLGAVLVEDQPVMVISPLSPVGNLLKGKRAGDSFEFNGLSREIIAIC